MMTNQKSALGPESGTFGSRGWVSPQGLVLLGLAVIGLLQSGCRSDGCYDCGIGSAVSKGVQAVGSGFKAVGDFVFHHKKGCGGGSDCGCGGESIGGMEEGVIVDSGIPVVPGAMAIPAPGTIVPAPSIETPPTELYPLPGTSANPTSSSGNSATKPTTKRSTPSTNTRSGYTTSLDKRGSTARPGTEADQALYSSANPLARPVGPKSTADLLENIPPVDLPSEVTRKATVPTTVAPPSTTTASPAPNPGSGSPTIVPSPAEKVSAVEGGPLVLPTINNISANQAPGLHRFASVAPAIGGGSAPSLEGLDWLKEKGYRTFIDLRGRNEVEPDFVDAVNDRGMVYISLPILANRLDSSRLARFDDLLSRNENRPLFFCDTDGNRSALVWYIHQRTVGKDEAQAARSQAEELGLTDVEFKIAEDYLATRLPKVRAAMARLEVPVDPPAKEVDSTPVITPPALPATTEPPVGPVVIPQKLEEASPAMLPGESRPQAANVFNPFLRDPASWRPAAAMILTSIGVPLAFWGRTVFSEFRSVRRQASLPGSTPRSLDAPGGSDA